MAAIEVSDLRKAYGPREVLHGIGFSVEPGEVFALLGPNGAGKTTTVEILEGYRPRDGGDARVLGIDPGSGGRAFRSRVGIVLQSSAVYPNLTVEEIVRLFAGYYPRPRPVGEVIGIVGLDGERAARVRTLSGGQLRRLDLALALAGDPELLFLDEPTTGFDPGARRQAWETILELKRLGKTVLLTTHYLDEAGQLADRLAILRDGRIAATGTPRELLTTNGRVEIRFRRDGEQVVAHHGRPDPHPARADERRDRRRLVAGRARGAPPLARGRLPRPHPGRRVMRLLLHELGNQQRLFWRSRESAFFTFLLPIILLVLLGSVYGDEEIAGDPAAPYLVAGMIGFGVVATAYAGLAINTVIRRESGVLKRVRGTPLPPAIYLAAAVGSTIVVIAIETSAQLLIGRFVIDAGWPERPGLLAVAILLGAVAFAALGLATTGLVRSAEGSSAVVNAIYLPMVFISGVFFSVSALPGFLEAIADVLPLTYFLDLVRGVFIDGEGLGSQLTAIGVVALWGLLGLVVALRTFRWAPREG